MKVNEKEAVKKREPVYKYTGCSYEKDFIKSEATHYLLGGTLPKQGMKSFEKNVRVALSVTVWGNIPSALADV